jgi:hypothetical protein
LVLNIVGIVLYGVLGNFDCNAKFAYIWFFELILSFKWWNPFTFPSDLLLILVGNSQLFFDSGCLLDDFQLAHYETPTLSSDSFNEKFGWSWLLSNSSTTCHHWMVLQNFSLTLSYKYQIHLLNFLFLQFLVRLTKFISFF